MTEAIATLLHVRATIRRRSQRMRTFQRLRDFNFIASKPSNLSREAHPLAIVFFPFRYSYFESSGCALCASVGIGTAPVRLYW